MRANIQRIQDHIETIGRYTATPGEGTTRLSYSEEDRLARAYIKQQMSRYGLAVREDAVGNIYGRVWKERCLVRLPSSWVPISTASRTAVPLTAQPAS
jgi:hypothetical protein